MPKNPILIIGAETHQREIYAQMLTSAGFSVVHANTQGEALSLSSRPEINVAIVDAGRSEADCIDLVMALCAKTPNFKTIALADHLTHHISAKPIHSEIFDTLIKPVEPQTLLNAVTNARSEYRSHPPSLLENVSLPMGGLIGSSDQMKHIYATIRSVAWSDVNVFILGENGTGKAHNAEAIHAQSKVSSGQFVHINCGAIHPGALEAELFGQAESLGFENSPATIGAIERADGGTLFLDEVCELDPRMQARLLQVIQTSSVTPIGATTAKPIKIRVISTSSSDPLKLVQAEKFRADLYYRLHVVPIHLPPLRERGLDVIEIAEAMIERFSAKEARPPRILSQEAHQVLLSYSWPGNIRELMNLLWGIVVVSDGPEIQAHHLKAIANKTETAGPHTSNDLPLDQSSWFFGKTLAEAEREVIDHAIGQADGSIPKAARALDVSPSTLYRKLESWGRPARGTRRS